ncbi:MAG: fatty acid desaturase family protein [Pseudonocardiaceae bacterium]
MGVVASGEAVGERSEQTYKKGYSAPSQLRDNIKHAHQTRLAVTVTSAVVDIATVGGVGLVAGVAVTRLPWWAAGFVVLAGAMVIGRQLRGLENLVHEGSHYNWSRHHRRLNDALTVGLAAAPVGAKVQDYRAGHLRHHGRFGTDHDPDLQRYRELDLEAMDRNSRGTFTLSILRRFPSYQRGWLREVGADSLWSLVPFLWAGLIVVAPAIALAGTSAARGAGAAWVLGYLAALPLLRLVAEASEHVYTDSSTMFDATISNLGWVQRYILHPHNDGYHTIHHMWPGIPHHQLARVHRTLMLHDPDGYGARLRYRATIRQRPIRSGQAVAR